MKHNGTGFEDARILISGLKWMFDSMQLAAPLKDRAAEIRKSLYMLAGNKMNGPSRVLES